MASRKKPEDKNLQILRELVSQPNNKKCFDCRQRGPTYVNMTVGCFVCTSCSGMLRGLNPPHRVKSISMATFNAQEITFLQNHGNEVCRLTWLGLWNSPLPPEPESREEQKLKDFLVKKYERRTWYTSQPQAKSPTPEIKPLKQLLGDSAPKVVIGNQPNKIVSLASASSETSTTSIRRTSSQQSQPPAFNLLGDLGADPFGGTSSQQPQQQQQQPFPSSSFDAFASSPTAVASFSGFGQPQNQPQQATFDAFGTSPTRKSSGSFTSFASAYNNQDFFQSSASTAPNGNPSNGRVSISQSVQIAAPAGVGDRYSALSDLDDLFRSSNTSSVFSTQSASSNSQQQQPQQQKQQQQQQQQFSNSQPNPFMSPASGASGVAMFQQQQQKPANPFHQNVAAQHPMPNANLQQTAQNNSFAFGALPGNSFANKSSAGGWPGNANAQQQQPPQQQQFQGLQMQHQGGAFGQFNNAQQQHQPVNSVAPFSSAQPFGSDPQQQQQQQFPFGGQPMHQGIQGNQQYQTHQSHPMQHQQFNQFNGGNTYQPMPTQQTQQKMISPQQFAGWGAAPSNPASIAMPHQQQQQHRSSTNPFM